MLQMFMAVLPAALFGIGIWFISGAANKEIRRLREQSKEYRDEVKQIRRELSAQCELFVLLKQQYDELEEEYSAEKELREQLEDSVHKLKEKKGRGTEIIDKLTDDVARLSQANAELGSQNVEFRVFAIEIAQMAKDMVELMNEDLKEEVKPVSDGDDKESVFEPPLDMQEIALSSCESIKTKKPDWLVSWSVPNPAQPQVVAFNVERRHLGSSHVKTAFLDFGHEIIGRTQEEVVQLVMDRLDFVSWE